MRCLLPRVASIRCDKHIEHILVMVRPMCKPGTDLSLTTVSSFDDSELRKSALHTGIADVGLTSKTRDTFERSSSDVSLGEIYSREPSMSRLSMPPLVQDDVEDNPKLAPASGLRSWFKILSLSDKWDILLVTLGTLGAAVRGAVFPVVNILLGKVIEDYGQFLYKPNLLSAALVKIAIAHLCIAAGLLLAGIFEATCWSFTGQRQAIRFRTRFLESVLIQEVGYFDTESNVEEVLSNISTEIASVEAATGRKVGQFLANVVQFIASFLTSIIICWQIGLLTVVLLPILAIGVVGNTAASNYAAKAAAEYGKADTIMEEIVSQIRTVYSYVGEHLALLSYLKPMKTAADLQKREGLSKGIGLGIANFATCTSWALCVFVAGMLVVHTQYSVQTTISTMFMVIMGSTAIISALREFQHLLKGKAAAEKLFRIIDRVPRIKDSANACEPQFILGHIVFNNVQFCYPSRPNVPILRNFSLNIPANKSIALVGESGSGKSTVMALISRYYDPVAGQISVDGRDIKNLKLSWLRNHVGFVGQEPALFDTFILENIRLGHLDATLEEIDTAAKAANAFDFIMELPLGYQTQVGANGFQLSGGQKQRLAIARAVVKKPRILLLDEATSALDVESEKLVQDALDSVMVGRTTVIIAHRLSTIKNVDVIAVVRNGRVVELGTHTDLLARGPAGAYYNLSKIVDKSDDQQPQRRNASTAQGHRVWRPAPASPYRSSPMSPFWRQYTPSSYGSALTTPGYADASFVTAYGDTSPYTSGRSKLWSPELAEENSDSGTEDAFRDEQCTIPSHKLLRKALSKLSSMRFTDCLQIVMALAGAIVIGCIWPTMIWGLVTTGLKFHERPSAFKPTMERWIIVFVILGCFICIGHFLMHYCSGQAADKLNQKVRERVFEGVMKNEIEWFDREENSNGAITRRLATDTAYLKSLITDYVTYFVVEATAIALGLTLSVWTEWHISLAVLAVMPVYVFAGAYGAISSVTTVASVRNACEEADSLATEAVINFKVITSFNLREEVLSRLRQTLRGPLRKGFLFAMLSGATHGIATSGTQIANSVALYYLAFLIKRDGLDFRSGYKSFQITLLVGIYLQDLLEGLPALTGLKQAMNNIFNFLDRDTVMNPIDDHARKPNKIKGTIEFRKVHFCYPLRPDVPVLHDFSLKIKKGRTVALVGESGSGKSSIISLIERFYDIQSGLLMIDNTNIENYHLRTLRLHIALVQQQPALFNTSIKQNILYGNRLALESEIIQAAEAANAHSFISALPAGYNTIVGQRGAQLSGGQKQRIAIARAVLKKPSILLLDEATSALDLESEKTVQSALDKLMGAANSPSRTTVIVAHRLSTIRLADTIVVLRKGRIIEEGSHTELLTKNGVYAGMLAVPGDPSTTFS